MEAAKMLETLAYQEQDVLLQNIHPLVLILFLTALFLPALLFTNPLFLTGFFLAAMLLVLVSRAFAKCEFYLVGGLWMALLLIVVNAMVAHNGQTIIWYGPEVPLLGRLNICLEAVCYGAVMGIRLLIILLVFALYNAMMHPDKVLSLFSRVASKSALILSISTRMLPAVARDLTAAMEVQQMRGVDFNSGGIFERLRKYSWLLNIVLVSSLEGSLATAEAIQARAYGSGPRTSYKRFIIRPRDHICCLAGILVITFSIYAKLKGYGDYIFYPYLASITGNGLEFIFLGLIMLPFMLVAAVGWGWNYCHSLKSRI